MNILVNKFFHIMEGKHVKYQGRIIGYIGSGYYLIQLYDFIDGNPSYKKIANCEKMIDWIFHETEDEWVTFYNGNK